MTQPSINDTLQQIRLRFPAPRMVGDDDGEDTCYCVGGAACLFAEMGKEDAYASYGNDWRFPNNTEVADALVVLNPDLEDDAAFEFAEELIFYNDLAAFEEAWAILGEALAYSNPQESLAFEEAQC